MTKVVLFVLDGCRADGIRKANTPNMDALEKSGIRVNECTSIFPTITGAAQASILCGAYPNKTGITGHFFWDSQNKYLHDINSSRYCESEMIFDVLSRNGIKNTSIGPRMSWRSSGRGSRNIFRSITDLTAKNQMLMRTPYLLSFFKNIRASKWVSRAKGGFEDFKKILQKNEHDFIYMVFDDTDRAGHLHGPESDKYYTTIEKIDKKIGEAIEISDDLGEETTFIITSDHGQTTIDERLPIEELVSLDNIGYRIDEISEHPIGREIRIVKYNEGKDNEAIATFVTRHMQMWLNDNSDAQKIIKEFRKKINNSFIMGKEKNIYHLDHPRLSDITLSLKNGTAFDTNDWVGDHGGINNEDIQVPLIIGGERISKGTLDHARTIDIAPTISTIFGIENPADAQGRSLLVKKTSKFKIKGNTHAD